MQIRLNREHIVGDTPRPPGTVIDVDTVTGQWLIDNDIGIKQEHAAPRAAAASQHHSAPAKAVAEPKHEPLQEDAK